MRGERPRQRTWCITVCGTCLALAHGVMGMKVAHAQATTRPAASAVSVSKVVEAGRPQTLDSQIREARQRAQLGDADGAAQAYREALSLPPSEAAAGLAMAEPLNELALWHAARGERAEANALLGRAQRLLEDEGDSQEMALARLLASRAQLLAALGQEAGARDMNERALKLLRAHEAEGATVWLVESGVLTELAGQLYRRRRLREAEPLFVQALECMERAVGPVDARLLPPLENLLTLYRVQGRREAEAVYARRAEELRRQLGQR